MKDNIPTGDLAYIVSCDLCAPKKTEVRDGALHETEIVWSDAGSCEYYALREGRTTLLRRRFMRVRNLHHDEHYETEKSLTQKSGLSRR